MDHQFVRTRLLVEAEETVARAQARDVGVGPLARQAAPAARWEAPRVERTALQRTFDASAAQGLEQVGHPIGTIRVILRAFYGNAFP